MKKSLILRKNTEKKLHRNGRAKNQASDGNRTHNPFITSEVLYR